MRKHLFMNLLNPIICCVSLSLCIFEEGLMERWRTRKKNINCASDGANLILEPTRKAYTERNWDVFSRESARELSPEYREFWRTPQETHGKEIWCQKETNVMATAGTNSPGCRVRHYIVGLWSRRRNSYKHM